MMPCPCQNATAPIANNNSQQSNFTPVQNFVFDENCPFTLQIIQQWYTKLSNVKNSNTADLYNITYAQINSYLGIIQSAMNFSNNICFFRGDLERIEPIVNVLP